MGEISADIWLKDIIRYRLKGIIRYVVMEQRECKQCKEMKDLTPTNFFVDSLRGKGGYRVTCKVCEMAKRKESYHESDKTVHAERMKKYREDNIEKITEQRKQYRESNQDKIKQQNEANKDRSVSRSFLSSGSTVRFAFDP